MADIAKRVLLLGLLSIVAFSLGACREDEQGRLLSFEAGKFMGKNPDQPFNEELSASLRSRTHYQSGSTAPVGGSKKIKSASIDGAKLQSLRLRAWSQSGRK